MTRKTAHSEQDEAFALQVRAGMTRKTAHSEQDEAFALQVRASLTRKTAQMLRPYLATGCVLMRYNPEVHYRRSMRLNGYDYRSVGAYFVTICAWQRQPLFGTVENTTVNLNPLRQIVKQRWLAIPYLFRYVELDVFEVMPDHLHGIIVITEDVTGATGVGTKHLRSLCTASEASSSANASSRLADGSAGTDSAVRRPAGTASRSLSAIIQNFKTVSTRKVNSLRGTPGSELWQPRFHDRIIRSDRELDAIRGYIALNPFRCEPLSS